MDIFELAEKSGVSIRNLRKLEKLNALKISKSASNSVLLRIKENLRKGNKLTAEHLAYLVQYPEWIGEVGANYESGVQKAVSALGDVASDKMPWDIAANIPFAISGEHEMILPIVEWIKNFIDTSPAFAGGQSQPHAYLAVRLLADVPSVFLAANSPEISKLMWRVRGHPEFVHYWSVDSHKRTQYHRPVKSGFDL